MINNVNLEGRIVRDIEIKDFNGTKIVNNVLAVYGGKDKDGVEITHFIDFKAFNYNADKLCHHASKGSKIVICGDLRVDKWENDDKKYSKVVVYADSVFIGSSEKAEEKNESQEESDMPY